MKKIFKRNQVVLTLLAVMIAVAGYLNYTADTVEEEAMTVVNNQKSSGLMDISEEDLLQENLSAVSKGQITVENMDEAGENRTVESPEMIEEEPGNAILTNSTDILEYVAGVQLSREQTRAKNKELLQGIIENANVGEEQKQEAVREMVRMTNTAEKETAAESLLAAKGYENSIVYMNENSVDVVINRETLSDAERAQIEDIVKRKTEYTVDKIVITLLDMGQ